MWYVCVCVCVCVCVYCALQFVLHYGLSTDWSETQDSCSRLFANHGECWVVWRDDDTAVVLQHQVIRCRCGALQLLQWEGPGESECEQASQLKVQPQ